MGLTASQVLIPGASQVFAIGVNSNLCSPGESPARATLK